MPHYVAVKKKSNQHKNSRARLIMDKLDMALDDIVSEQRDKRKAKTTSYAPVRAQKRSGPNRTHRPSRTAAISTISTSDQSCRVFVGNLKYDVSWQGNGFRLKMLFYFLVKFSLTHLPFPHKLIFFFDCRTKGSHATSR
jgi:hypothetical protein